MHLVHLELYKSPSLIEWLSPLSQSASIVGSLDFGEFGGCNDRVRLLKNLAALSFVVKCTAMWLSVTMRGTEVLTTSETQKTVNDIWYQVDLYREQAEGSPTLSWFKHILCYFTRKGIEQSRAEHVVALSHTTVTYVCRYSFTQNIHMNVTSTIPCIQKLNNSTTWWKLLVTTKHINKVLHIAC